MQQANAFWLTVFLLLFVVWSVSAIRRDASAEGWGIGHALLLWCITLPSLYAALCMAAVAVAP